MFTSMNKTFESTSTLNDDVRELIPEFYMLSELFLNRNNINLAQNKLDAENNLIIINDVKLPLWSNNNPINFVVKLRSYLELKRPDAIESQLQKTSLKKMGLTPMHLGEMFFDYKYYDKAAEYLMQVKDPFYFSYVIDILKSMEKYKEALEYIIASKDIDDKQIMVNEILRKQPKLEKFVNDLCEKYKVSLQ